MSMMSLTKITYSLFLLQSFCEIYAVHILLSVHPWALTPWEICIFIKIHIYEKNRQLTWDISCKRIRRKYCLIDLFRIKWHDLILSSLCNRKPIYSNYQTLKEMVHFSPRVKELTHCPRRQSFRSSTSPRPRMSTWSGLTARSWNAKYRALYPSSSTWISGRPTMGRFTRPDRSTVWCRSTPM